MFSADAKQIKLLNGDSCTDVTLPQNEGPGVFAIVDSDGAAERCIRFARAHLRLREPEGITDSLRLSPRFTQSNGAAVSGMPQSDVDNQANAKDKHKKHKKHDHDKDHDNNANPNSSNPK